MGQVGKLVPVIFHGKKVVHIEEIVSSEDE
jgi:hypothetical protein